VLRSLPEKVARNLFIALHVPIFGYLIWASSVGPPAVKTGTEIILSLFMLIHSVIHWRLRNRESYEFKRIDSQFYIYGSAVFAGLFLINRILNRDGAF
jgi:hypothetical protein